MRTLITGAAGFAGQHLARYLAGGGHEVILHDLHEPRDPKHPLGPTFCGDLCDAGHIERVVAEAKPEACVHLGGLAFVPAGWLHPRKMYEVNLLGTVNVFEAFRKHAPGARLLFVSSSEVYGRALSRCSLDEEALPAPGHPYAIAKLAAEQHVRVAGAHHQLTSMVARPNNHTGPGQAADFVVPAFARQLAAIARGQKPPVMRVGNLDTVRSFTDVRDVARAYARILEAGTPGRVYNIAAGVLVRIGEVLEALCRLAGVAPSIEVDPDLYRPSDDPLELDATRIRTELGWRPEIDLHTTLRDIYDEAFAQLRNA